MIRNMEMELLNCGKASSVKTVSSVNDQDVRDHFNFRGLGRVSNVDGDIDKRARPRGSFDAVQVTCAPFPFSATEFRNGRFFSVRTYRPFRL